MSPRRDVLPHVLLCSEASAENGNVLTVALAGATGLSKPGRRSIYPRPARRAEHILRSF